MTSKACIIARRFDGSVTGTRLIRKVRLLSPVQSSNNATVNNTTMAHPKRTLTIIRYQELIAEWDAKHPKEAAAGKPWPKALWKQAFFEIYGYHI